MALPGGDGTRPPPDSSSSGPDKLGQGRPGDSTGSSAQGGNRDGRRRSATVARFVLVTVLALAVTVGLVYLYYEGRLGADPPSANEGRTSPCAPAKVIATPDDNEASPADTAAPTVTPSAPTTQSSGAGASASPPDANAGDVVGSVGGADVSEPTVVDAQITIGDLTRGYRLHLPGGYDGSRPTPLVVLLAGTGGTIDSTEAYTGLPDSALTRGYAVVTPAQAPTTDGLPTHWTVPGFPGPPDVQFIESLVTSLQTSYCVDPQRIYATGISAGAAFATQLACKTTMFAAIAPIAGLNLIRKCDGRPEPMVVFHGTADQIVPYGGVEDVFAVNGVVTNPDTFFNGPIEKSVQEWADRNGCSATSAARIEPDITVTFHTSCRDSSDVVFYSIAGGGHTWPGVGDTGFDDQGGRSTTTIRANDVMLDFFDRHIMIA